MSLRTYDTDKLAFDIGNDTAIAWSKSGLLKGETEMNLADALYLRVCQRYDHQ